MADWSRSTWNDAGQIVLLVDSDADPGEANGKALPEWYGQLIARGELGEAVGGGGEVGGGGR